MNQAQVREKELKSGIWGFWMRRNAPYCVISRLCAAAMDNALPLVALYRKWNQHIDNLVYLFEESSLSAEVVLRSQSVHATNTSLPNALLRGESSHLQGLLNRFSK